MTVDLTEATLGQDGQLIITGEDGQGETSYETEPK
jgi:nuclear respiratory factor 1